MPSGYTCVIEDNPDLTLREFVLRCARGFGFCIHMREEPLENPPRPYDGERLESIQERITQFEGVLRELRDTNEEERRAAWETHTKEIARLNAEYKVKQAKKRASYERMQRMVEAWVPPSKSHHELKKFMLSQIGESLGDVSTYLQSSAATPGDYHAQRIKGAEWQLECAKKDLVETERAIKNSKEWLDALYESLTSDVKP